MSIQVAKGRRGGRRKGEKTKNERKSQKFLF
jgi:hypothetical protein